jgi:hypothetical protein
LFPGAEFNDDLDPFIRAIRWHNEVKTPAPDES